ncbi:hypothetical protein MSAN_01041200 [Mycena sanguinolenta]|uniref:Uncharacterized protein n=1 Tax=Mycena sanguinolenta TaxID=230812 RepID=A0A8H6YS23_9AGAR|nr:hypothetical protein MSAN_01041200 [Mycena sanguinolenta]
MESLKESGWYTNITPQSHLPLPPPQSEGILEKLGLEHPAAPPPPPPPPPAAPQHESVLEKLGLEHHPPSPPPTYSLSVVPQHESLLEKLGVEHNHSPSAPPPPPKQQGVLEKLLDHHTTPADPAAAKHEGILEKLGLEHEHGTPLPPVPPKQEGMFAKIRHDHQQPHESGPLENLKAGWVTPPPPKHEEGLLEKIGLAAPSQAPEHVGFLGHHQHDVPPPPTERLVDRVEALGHGVLAGREHPPKPKEHGLVHKLSGVFNSEEKTDEGGISGLVRKINGDHRTEEKKEGVFDKAADFVHEHVHIDESTSEKIADAVRREYQKVEHSLENYYE